MTPLSGVYHLRGVISPFYGTVSGAVPDPSGVPSMAPSPAPSAQYTTGGYFYFSSLHLPKGVNIDEFLYFG